MIELRFPADRVVGTLDWVGSWRDDTGPVLATGTVSVPDDAAVHLEVQPIAGTERAGPGSWRLQSGEEPVDLSFVGDLPPDVIESVTIRSVRADSFPALARLAPGLRRLTLVWSDVGDEVLPVVASLTGLTSLQTFGNRFTDAGVQQLAALKRLEHLYLEEATLSAAAFDFVDRLPSLAQLGLQDVDLDDAELAELAARLPEVRVGR